MENWIKSAAAFFGAATSYFYGGWSYFLQALLVFVVLDYLTGVLASGREGRLSSRIGGIGILRKVLIFAIVAVAHIIDQMLGDGHLFRDGTITFYLANELLSIVENTGRLGLPVPDSIQRAIEILKGNEKESRQKEVEKQ